MLTSVEFALALIYKFNSEVHWNAESQGTFVKLGHLDDGWLSKCALSKVFSILMPGN